MHPDVPLWAREILQREVARVEFTSFHVLKDTALHKLGVGHTTGREAYVVQKTLAGGELFRVQVQRHEREMLDAVFRVLAPEHAVTAECATCPSCRTTFRYWYPRERELVYCFGCGAPITQDQIVTQDGNGNGGGPWDPESPVQRA